MPDTGAPWNIPYVAGTDLVRDWPTDSQELAEAVADGLDAAGGLVEVKSALFTGTQSNSTAAGANFAVTDLSITHETADAANKLIISAHVGFISPGTNGLVGIGVYDGTSLIGVGDAANNRVQVSAADQQTSGSTGGFGTSAGITFVHTPGSGSKTYTVRVMNLETSTNTVYVNRSTSDTNNAENPRAASSLVIQEVKV